MPWSGYHRSISAMIGWTANPWPWLRWKKLVKEMGRKEKVILRIVSFVWKTKYKINLFNYSTCQWNPFRPLWRTFFFWSFNIWCSDILMNGGLCSYSYTVFLCNVSSLLIISITWYLAYLFSGIDFITASAQCSEIMLCWRQLIAFHCFHIWCLEVFCCNVCAELSVDASGSLNEEEWPLLQD